MKEYWHNLSIREKQILILISIVIGLCLIYLFIFSPLNNKINNLRNQIKHNQELSTWMQEINKRIITLEKKSQKTSDAKAVGSLLNIVQKNINAMPFANNITALQQVDAHSVRFIFKAVDFNDLIKWLIHFSQKNTITILQVAIIPSKTPGIVSATLVLGEK